MPSYIEEMYFVLAISLYMYTFEGNMLLTYLFNK